MFDIQLIEECRNGNLHSFKILIGDSSPFAFSVALRMLGDEDLAKDVVQESMITLWSQLKKIKSAESFKIWLYRIVVNKCYDQIRQQKKQLAVRADDKTWAIISDRIADENKSDLETRETAMIIRMLTTKLSPRQKAVFVLSELEEMDAEEISSITGMSKKNIKANLFYARKRISEMIEKYI